MTTMPGGTLFDVANAIADWTWRLFAAVSIVMALVMVRKLVYSAYNKAIQTSACYDAQETWQVYLNLQMVWLFVMIVSVIAAAGIVVDEEWIKQITSACIVGVGFALRQFIEDIVWGMARRSDPALMKSNKMITIMTSKGKPVAGSIRNMNITSCHVLSGSKVIVVPWAEFRMYSFEND
tara:strand:- start:76 stop:612 length:537 start_codon:yes stop_codon:yes gene_type:complete